MFEASNINKIFKKSIEDYHKYNNVDQKIKNPYSSAENTGTNKIFESLLYVKNWIDTVQWHLEDIIRDPDINPTDGLQLKRRIDKSNQERTDTVEQIDDHFLEHFKDVKQKSTAKMNTESPAWVVDRMSILCLKIYHMEEETKRDGADEVHIKKCSAKLKVLLEQQDDLIQAFTSLIDEIEAGDRYMKVYRQMKMYNDPSLNPELYSKTNI